jgi:hypothetical protein
MPPDSYGSLYYCIKTDLSEDGEIYIMGDTIEINSHGDLIIHGSSKSGSDKFLFAAASGHWSSIFAASVIDGSAIAVEYWKGEVIPRDGRKD